MTTKKTIERLGKDSKTGKQLVKETTERNGVKTENTFRENVFGRDLVKQKITKE